MGKMSEISGLRVGRRILKRRWRLVERFLKRYVTESISQNVS
jgi:hypothetical protein